MLMSLCVAAGKQEMAKGSYCDRQIITMEVMSWVMSRIHITYLSSHSTISPALFMVIYGIIWQQGDILTLEQISFIDSAITHWYCDIQLGTELLCNLDIIIYIFLNGENI